METLLTTFAATDPFAKVLPQFMTVGGSLLGVAGLIALVVGFIKAIHKGMSGERAQTSWAMIALLMIIGGAAMFGGISLVTGLGKTGNDFVNSLGLTSSMLLGW